MALGRISICLCFIFYFFIPYSMCSHHHSELKLGLNSLCTGQRSTRLNKKLVCLLCKGLDPSCFTIFPSTTSTTIAPSTSSTTSTISTPLNTQLSSSSPSSLPSSSPSAPPPAEETS